jgi:uncharacterized protein YaaQ
MKLILAIVQDKDARALMSGLVAAEFQATKLASTGGFLREGNATILIGTEEGRMEAVLAIIQKTCHVREQLVSPLPPVVEPVDSYISAPVKVQVGGAVVFVLDVERMVKI